MSVMDGATAVQQDEQAPSTSKLRLRKRSGGRRAPQESWTLGAEWAGRAATWGVLACMASGLLAVVLILTGVGRPTVETGPATPAGPPAAVTDAAQSYVTAYLSTDAAHAAAFQRDWWSDTQVRFPATALAVISTDTAGATATGGVWSVVVAARVADPATTKPGTAPAVTRRYLQVPLRVTKTGAVSIAGLPATVPAPGKGPDLVTDYGAETTVADSVQGTVTTFLRGLLVGGSDLSLVSAPGSTFTPVTPAPARQITVGGITVRTGQEDLAAQETPDNGTSVKVLVTVDLIGKTRDQALTSTYPLTLTGRDGRWEVSAIDPLPAIDVAGSNARATTP